MIGYKPARQPHHLNVAPSLMLKPPARLNPIEIAVDVKLQQDRRVIRRPAGRFGGDPIEPKPGQIEFLDKDVDHPNRIILADPVFQALRKQRALPAIRALNKALHPILRSARIILRSNHTLRVFTQPGSSTVTPVIGWRGTNAPDSRHESA